MKRSGLRPGRAGMSPRVWPARECGEGRRHRDQRDAALRRLEELGFARFGQAVADAGLHEPGLGHVLLRELHAEHAVVAGVVVGARHQVEAGPHQLLHERRIGPHVGAAAFVRRDTARKSWNSISRFVNAASAPRISAMSRVNAGSRVDRELARDDRVAGEREGEVGGCLARRRRLGVAGDDGPMPVRAVRVTRRIVRRDNIKPPGTTAVPTTPAHLQRRESRDSRLARAISMRLPLRLGGLGVDGQSLKAVFS